MLLALVAATLLLHLGRQLRAHLRQHAAGPGSRVDWAQRWGLR